MANASKDDWIEQQAVAAVKRVRRRLGPCWTLFAPDVREAFACREIVLLLCSQDESLHHLPIATWITLAHRILITYQGGE